MDRDALQAAAVPGQLAAAIEQNGAALAVLHHRHPTGRSVREDDYNGHRIRVVTNYEITIDGTPVGGHLYLKNSGRVHYHSIPNQEFDSMIDMVKRIIDVSPDFPSSPAPHPPHGHGRAHTHDSTGG